MKNFNIALIHSALNYLRQNGIKKFWTQLQIYTSSDTSNYNYYIKRNAIKSSELELQKMMHFEIEPFFYFIYPHENSEHFTQLVKVLENQTYINFSIIAPKTLRNKVTLSSSTINVSFTYHKIHTALLHDSSNIYYIFLGEHAFPCENFVYELVKKINFSPTDFIYFDEDYFSAKGKTLLPHFKSDYNYDMLMQYNYIGDNFCISCKSASQIINILPNSTCNPSNYMIVFAKEFCKNIEHIDKIILHNHTIYSDSNILSHYKAVKLYFDYKKIKASIIQKQNKLRISYSLSSSPLISILIPNKDHINELSACLDSISKSTYTNYEIIIIENNSTEKETFSFYNQITLNKKIKILTWSKSFNYSSINNYGTEHASGDYFIFLNNDTKIISPSWIEEMLMYAQRPDVGIVGSLLLYPDNTIQHAGGIIGIQGIAGHSHKDLPASSPGYFNRICLAQDLSCVTAACMMVKKQVFNNIGGFDESLKVAFNDIDLCLSVRSLNKLVVYTPYAKLYHFESKSRGIENTPEKKARFRSEIEIFRKKWSDILQAGDPYYNRNLTLLYEDFSLKRKIEYDENFSFYN